jgi:apolipoprotein N-acyltransferase
MLTKYWPWFAAALSGVLVGLVYPPFNFSWLAWIGLIPLCFALWLARERGALRFFLQGYVFGLLYFGISLSWLTTVTGAGWVVLSLYLALFPAVWAWLAGSFCRPCGTRKRSPWLSSAENLIRGSVAAGAWVGLEWLRGILFSGFGWNGLGIGLHANIPLIQIAEITGVGGLSFLLILANTVGTMTLVRLSLEARRGARRPHWDFALAVTLVAFAFVFGVRSLAGSGETPGAFSIKVAAVQPNIPQDEKWDPAKAARIWQTFSQLTSFAAASDPDLLVWPEAATPRPLFSDRETWEFVREKARLWEGDFLLGTVHFDETGDFNSVVLLTGGAEDAQFYHKIHLVPFGEFVPFRKSFPLFAWIVGDLVPSDFDHGSDLAVLQMTRAPARLAPLICFEDTLGRLARRFVQRGANVFVTVTNDGWFLESAGSAQHAAHAVFRTVENRLPMVRAANTGVTCLIDRYGRVYEKLTDPQGSTFLEGVLVGHVVVEMDPAPTVYTLFGEWFSVFCLLASTAVILFWWWRERTRHLREVVTDGESGPVP